MRKYFEGYYFKHQKNNDIFAVIAGYSCNHAFIQILTNDTSRYISYPLAAIRKNKGMTIGDNHFSKNGIHLNIKKDGLSITGCIKYRQLTKIKYDIMGPFRYLPMQCRHRILSIHHKLLGSVSINNQIINFLDGVGYAEGDRGTSFPRRYLWLQCNDFPTKCSVSVSVAEIPFLGFHFTGCICIVYIMGREYRLATYLGVKLLCCDTHCIKLKQGKYILEILMEGNSGHKLLAPHKGKMKKIIKESVSCIASFRFYEGQRLLLSEEGKICSFEQVT